MREKRKILLLGGTGAMGVYLVPELLRMGYQVYITSRSRHLSNERDVIYLLGDAKDDDFLGQLLETRYDAIVDFMVYTTKQFRSRYQWLLDSTPHYLFLSSYRVYGDSHGAPITENSVRLLDSVDDPDYLSTDEYGLTKARQENLLFASGRRNWTILRPAITYSKERFQLGTMEAHEFLQRMLNGKTVIFPRQMLDKKATMSWAGDVAKLIARMILNEQAFGEAFTVSTSEHHTWREIMHCYERMLHTRIKIVDLAVYEGIIGRPYQIRYDRMLDRVIDNSKALRVTGMRQEDFMPLWDGLKIELTNFAKNPQYRGYNQSREKKMDAVTYSRVDNFVKKWKIRLKRAKELYRKKQLLPKIVSKIFLLPGLRKLRTPAKKVLRVCRERRVLTTIRRKCSENIRGVVRKAKIRRYDGAIITLTGAYNYGSIIQRWALQNFLKKNGLKFKLLDLPFMSHMGKNVGDRTLTQNFIDRCLDTEPFEPQFAKKYKSFIVGSDQVWRDFFNDWNKFGVFFLNFMDGVKKKGKWIGYAVSFGYDRWAGPYTKPDQKKRISQYVGKFDAVSVREKSGVPMVRELGKDAVQVLDPTLLCDAAEYSAIVDGSAYAQVPTAELFYYILDLDEQKQSLIDTAAKQLGLRAGGIYLSNRQPLEAPEVWLKGFRDAKFVITDSFHGMVFSIINRKQFCVFTNAKRGTARMAELLSLLGLEDRLIFPDDTDLAKFCEPIHWEAVGKKLDVLRKRSEEWLLKNLQR